MKAIHRTTNTAHYGADIEAMTGLHTWPGESENNGSIVRFEDLKKTYDTGNTKVEALKGVSISH